MELYNKVGFQMHLGALCGQRNLNRQEEIKNTMKKRDLMLLKTSLIFVLALNLMKESMFYLHLKVVFLGKKIHAR